MNGANGLFLVASTPHPAADGPGAERDSRAPESCAFHVDVFQHVVLFLYLSGYRSVLAKPLWVGVGAVELAARFIKLKLAGFRGFRRFCQKSRNLRRVER